MHGSKLNQEATNTYSKSYAAKITEAYFGQNEIISGQQIISITPIKQVNFFILKALFDEWQEEIKKYKSPYFDYKNEEVSQALKSFINTLSKNIQIKKDHFVPLVEKAVYSTLELLYDPAKYYLRLLNNSSAIDKTRDLKNSGKYIKLYKPIFDELLNALERDNNLTIAIQEVISNYQDTTLELTTTEELFSELITLDVLEQQVSADELPMPEPLDIADESPAESVLPVAEDINDEFEPIDELEEEPTVAIVNDKYEEDIKTLNQRYEEQEETRTLAAVHETKSLSNLKNNININQRYMFVNDLFEGNEEDYETAMDEVENCDSFDSSVELLVQTYAKKYQWDMNADEVKELLKVIFKRFR